MKKRAGLAHLKHEKHSLHVFFIKMGHPRPLFLLFSSFQFTVDSKQMFNRNK